MASPWPWTKRHPGGATMGVEAQRLKLSVLWQLGDLVGEGGPLALVNQDPATNRHGTRSSYRWVEFAWQNRYTMVARHRGFCTGR